MSKDRFARIEATIAALTRPLRLAGGRHSTLYCAFCGKSQHEADKLVAGPSIFICDEFTDLCYGIVHPRRAAVSAVLVPVLAPGLTKINDPFPAVFLPPSSATAPSNPATSG